MHIAEGILTGPSVVVTSVAGAAVLGMGAAGMAKFTRTQPDRKPLLGMAGAFIFLVSLVPLPAFTGTCTHPCGTPLAGMLLGPWIGGGLAALALLLQALFFAHGGLSTLGANTLTLGLLGAGSGWALFRLGRRMRLSVWAAAALGGLAGDVMTYVGAGLVLGTHLAFFAPTPQYSYLGYLEAIYLAYLPTQLPIAIGEMVFTGIVINSIARQRPEVLESLGVLPKVQAPRMAAAAALLIGLLAAPPATASEPSNEAPAAKEETAPAFPGMDEAVNEKLAEEAGAPSRPPLINTEEMGDLWNMLLLLGGGFAGFVIGRNWEQLFGRRPSPTPSAPA